MSEFYRSRLTYICNDTALCWFSKYGRRYKASGPCVITTTGRVFFSQSIEVPNYRNHCGPIDIHADGFIAYRNIFDESHRINGPAMIYADGSKEYWVSGKQLPADEFFIKYGVL